MELTSEEFQQGIEGVKKYFDEKTGEMKSYVDEKIGEVKIYVDEKTQEIRDETRKEFTEIHAQIAVMDKKIDNLAGDVRGLDKRLEDMKFFTSVTFGVLAVIVAFVAFVPIIGGMIAAFKRMFAFTRELDEKINQAVQKAIQENLKKS